MQGGAAESEGVTAHVWPEVRDDFETEHEVSYCRRCGQLLVADYNPGFVQAKPCRQVPITFRGASC